MTKDIVIITHVYHGNGYRHRKFTDMENIDRITNVTNMENIDRITNFTDMEKLQNYWYIKQYLFKELWKKLW